MGARGGMGGGGQTSWVPGDMCLYSGGFKKPRPAQKTRCSIFPVPGDFIAVRLSVCLLYHGHTQSYTHTFVGVEFLQNPKTFLVLHGNLALLSEDWSREMGGFLSQTHKYEAGVGGEVWLFSVYPHAIVALSCRKKRNDFGILTESGTEKRQVWFKWVTEVGRCERDVCGARLDITEDCNECVLLKLCVIVVECIQLHCKT